MGIKRQQDKPNKKELIMGIVLALFCLIALFLSLNGLGIFEDKTPIGFSCYYEDAILKKQYIDNTSSLHGGDCTKGCLFMDVYTEHFTFLRCGHIDNIKWENKTYFFANEGIRTDLKEGDLIQVKWCYIPNLDSCNRDNLYGCHRIREIKYIGKSLSYMLKNGQV